ncbi:uncharacterized protein LOC123393521 [Mustela putorius furo]|uniref:Uncharacterized protein LOC123393521 n=1 Tax=Mustela putorius furo TaxID=9669 RepID=A0A8U0SF19_MUSPF|nr:uncharacterized protein LOC123393521 [Mustela putorius furo]
MESGRRSAGTHGALLPPYAFQVPQSHFHNEKQGCAVPPLPSRLTELSSQVLGSGHNHGSSSGCPGSSGHRQEAGGLPATGVCSPVWEAESPGSMYRRDRVLERHKPSDHSTAGLALTSDMQPCALSITHLLLLAAEAFMGWPGASPAAMARGEQADPRGPTEGSGRGSPLTWPPQDSGGPHRTVSQGRTVHRGREREEDLAAGGREGRDVGARPPPPFSGKRGQLPGRG